MIKLKKPEVDMAMLVNDCIDPMDKSERKERLSISKDEIVQSTAVYDATAQKGELYTIGEHEKLESGATKDDMRYLYEHRFVQGPGRFSYEAIMLLAPNKRCPYCGQRDVTTLDHYLPKSRYPVFSISSFNLIPACGVCNHIKKDKAIEQKEDEVIHPYYDDFASDDEWLAAEVIKGDSVGFVFYIDAPDEWEKEKVVRIKNHFEVFKLNKLYQVNSAEEFVPCFKRIRRVYIRAGKEGAIESLWEDIEDRKELRNNTWQVAMYKALIESEWFWNEYVPSHI